MRSKGNGAIVPRKKGAYGEVMLAELREQRRGTHCAGRAYLCNTSPPLRSWRALPSHWRKPHTRRPDWARGRRVAGHVITRQVDNPEKWQVLGDLGLSVSRLEIQ